MAAFNPVSASDLVEDSWNTKAPMKQMGGIFGVVAVDGKIYAISGDLNECYDPETDKWVILKPMTEPMFNPVGIAAYQGKIYCIGSIIRDYRLISLTKVYDIATDSWSDKAAIPRIELNTPLQVHVVDGKIFVIFATMFLVDTPFGATDSRVEMFMYDPISDQWTGETTIMLYTYKGNSFGSAVVNDKIMFIGSFHFEISKPDTFRVIVYEPKTKELANVKTSSIIDHFVVPSFVSPDSVGTTSGSYAPQRIYIFQDTHTYIYDPTENKWATTKPMPTANRASFGVGIVDDVFYVIGGYKAEHGGGGVSYSVNEQYVPIGHYCASKPHLNDCVIVATVVITVGTTTACLVLYFNKKRKKK